MILKSYKNLGDEKHARCENLHFYMDNLNILTAVYAAIALELVKQKLIILFMT